ncbi:glycosyltransferase [Pseudobutyrivibrio ruminis]|uniref:glycosyltransferase n=1 Tax=Pseudobutyrivibrio ruminis TaxID=46206 RepID=UPI0004011BED|nr:glycosyltransferase [Pseudobutyrivibrio ruminis]
MKLSILVPIYNVSKYLPECLDSLLAQTVSDMEIICINDGSTDNCKSIIESYVSRDSRFKLIDKENTGYGNSLNMGLAAAQGEYIGIVESDDYIDAGMMHDLLSVIEKTQADVVKSDYKYSSFDDSLDNKKSNNLRNLPVDMVFNPLKEQGIFLVGQSLWSALYRRDFLSDNNITFHETPGASFQDVSFAFKVMTNAKKIYLIDRAYYHYRVSNPNASMKMDNKLDKLCSEINYIEEFIGQRKDRKALEPILSRLAFRILYENYQWAVPAYQFVMLNELASRLRIYESRGDFAADIWDDESVATAKEIIVDKDAFYKKTGKKIFDSRLWQGTMNASVYKDAILSKAIPYENIVLYGAGVVGSKIKDELLNRGVQKSQLTFAVTSKSDNQDEKDGIPVKQIDEFKGSGENTIFIITVKEEKQYEMLQNMQRLGIENVLFLSDEVRYSL